MRALAEQVRVASGLTVVEAFVGIQEPSLADVVKDIPPRDGLSAVIVPATLGGITEVYAAIAECAAERKDIVATGSLGPDERLARLVLDRVSATGAPPESTLVLAAPATDERARADAEEAAEQIRARWGGPVRMGYVVGPEPSIHDAVSAARAYGEDETVVVAAYLLTPGTPLEALAGAGADLVSAPLAPDPRLVDIVMARYDAAVQAVRRAA